MYTLRSRYKDDSYNTVILETFTFQSATSITQIVHMYNRTFQRSLPVRGHLHIVVRMSRKHMTCMQDRHGQRKALLILWRSWTVSLNLKHTQFFTKSIDLLCLRVAHVHRSWDNIMVIFVLMGTCIHFGYTCVLHGYTYMYLSYAYNILAGNLLGNHINFHDLFHAVVWPG